jgi:hypothetical protein
VVSGPVQVGHHGRCHAYSRVHPAQRVHHWPGGVTDGVEERRHLALTRLARPLLARARGPATNLRPPCVRQLARDAVALSPPVRLAVAHPERADGQPHLPVGGLHPPAVGGTPAVDGRKKPPSGRARRRPRAHSDCSHPGQGRLHASSWLYGPARGLLGVIFGQPAGYVRALHSRNGTVWASARKSHASFLSPVQPSHMSDPHRQPDSSRRPPAIG